ncbi:MAG: bifunctional phosphopantothenoylcysteine decarboxylase/phosphopantothenate--cysteine ligase CoaBC [Candidatus Thiodiazotropha sp. (ex Epidulcina cf. delphinae)]|nr:bifunctional phosphopantothenoylcysteine decarboxylase/phosphopantothenate--cysteine ligase CoaBC [Candidatus Thiodiazotropha sp. (ex Epidulcina cf. delphinae)]
MSSIENKKILLGVTGGIAAYKSAVLLRALQKAGAEVRVVLTQAAQAFVTPLTFQALSGHAVYTELLDSVQEAAMDHISLARWADLVLVAPATADFIARAAAGHANDLLATLCLATRAPIALAPAMNQQMWLNPVTGENLERLVKRGYRCWGPDDGEQACGETGPGRMLEPEALLKHVLAHFAPGSLDGVSVLMTAGSTREPIDPVRFVGNRSSGKMGYALAESLRDLGASVILVSGPVSLAMPRGIECIRVETAEQMRSSVLARVEACDIFVGVAAVADYRPRQSASEKIKKHKEIMTLELVRNPDILAEVAARDRPPFSVGFAAETEQVETFAEAKRRAKGLDMIAANRVGTDEGGFESDSNAIVLIWQGGREALPMMTKSLLAQHLAGRISERYHARTRS